MSSIIDEFEFIIGDENDAEDSTTFEENSTLLAEKASNFIENANKNPDTTYQGIKISQYLSGLDICESEIVPWKHVKFTINVNDLKDLSNGRLKDFIVPPFVEELAGIGDKVDSEFGFNQYGRNELRYIKIPNSVIVINPKTFAFYKRLETIEFEDDSNLIYLGEYAFACCDNLHTVDLRNCSGLDEIKKGTFDNSGVKTLKISSNIKSVCSLENTSIERVYIDNSKYTIDEFNQLIAENEETENEETEVETELETYDF